MLATLCVCLAGVAHSQLTYQNCPHQKAMKSSPASCVPIESIGTECSWTVFSIEQYCGWGWMEVCDTVQMDDGILVNMKTYRGTHRAATTVGDAVVFCCRGALEYEEDLMIYAMTSSMMCPPDNLAKLQPHQAEKELLIARR